MARDHVVVDIKRLGIGDAVLQPDFLREEGSRDELSLRSCVSGLKFATQSAIILSAG